MATQALRKEYAARAQSSNIFDGTQQPSNARPSKRLVQGHGASNVFTEDGETDLRQVTQVARSKPAPAPFLTDDNAVNTHGRLGGYVNLSDSLLAVDAGEEVRQEVRQEVREEPEVDNNCHETLARVEKMNENAVAANVHRQRNQTSHIFDDPATPEPVTRRPVYDRNTISNVF